MIATDFQFAACVVACATASLLPLAGCDETPTTTADVAVTADASKTDQSAVSDGTASADGTGAKDGSGTGSDGTSPADTVVSPGVLAARSLRYEINLHGAWGASPDDLWVVGDKGAILHWNGKALVARDSGTTKNLYAVGGTSASDVWFVGDSSVALHWNGQSLVEQSPTDTQVPLRAVAASGQDTLYAAGDSGTIYSRCCGGSWKIENAKASFNLHGIWSNSPGQVWAVGEQGQAVKLAGGIWTVTSLPKANKTLRAITGAASGKLYAVGDSSFLAGTSAGAWEVTLANDPDNRDLLGVWAVSDLEAWAVGAKGALLHLFDKKWQLDQISGTYMKLKTFEALWGWSTKAGPVDAFAFGPDGAGIRYDVATQKWQDFRAETTADLRQVVAYPNGSFVACGSAGVVLRAADATAPFYDLAAPITGSDVNDCAPRGEELWLAADDGVVAQLAAGKWTLHSTGLTAPVRGVADVAGQVLAVAEDGKAALRKSDGTWLLEPTATQLPLHSVAAAGGDAFVVGAVGTVLRRTAAGQWTKEAIAETGDLQRVIAWGNGEAMAVGDGGAVWLRQNDKWQKVFESPGLPLYGAMRKADGTLVAVGWAGALVVGKPGGTFAKLETKVANVLRGIALGPKGALAVGLKGGVFGVAEKLP